MGGFKITKKGFCSEEVMMNIKTLSFLLILLLIAPTYSNAQSIINSYGIPFTKSFSRKDYKGGTQTWSITQDNRGIMYFANNTGILEFDGIHWKNYPLDNGSIVRKVYTAKSGKIYIGAFNEFGYLQSDSTGRISYHSISVNLPPELKDFGEIWSITETKNGILFQSFSHLFLSQKNSTKILLEKKQLNYTFKTNDHIYIGDIENGLLEFKNEKLVNVEWAASLKGKIVTSIVTSPDRYLIIGTSFNGLYVYNGHELIKINNDASDFLRRNQLYSMIELNNNLFVAGTIKDGIIFFDANGNINKHLNRETGLQNNSVLNLFLDMEKNLWVALDNGINLIKLNTPVSMLYPPDEYGTGYVSIQKDDYLYFGTNHGLYYSSKKDILKTRHKANLNPIEQASGQVWNLQNIDGTLVCGHHKGAFEINSNQAVKVSDIAGIWKFSKLKTKKNQLIASTYTGLALFEMVETTSPSIKPICKIEGFNESCREMEVDNNGDIWLSHPYKGIFRIQLTENNTKIKNIEFYNSGSGLPSDYRNYITTIDGTIQSLSSDGIYRYNAINNVFELNSKLTSKIGTQRVDRLCTDSYGNIWYFQNNEMGLLQANFKGVYHSEKVPYNELKDNFIQGFEHITSIDNKSLIISYENGFLLFDKTIASKMSNEFNVLIRNVSTITGEKIFEGGIHSTLKQSPLPNTKNSLRFSASALSYANPDKTKYSFWLEGYDKTWSEWSVQSTKEYTQLQGGHYIFHVKAKNPIQIESNEATYSFVILKPWYLSNFSIFIYTVLIVVLFWLIYKYLLRKLERDKIKLKEKQLEQLRQKEKEFEYEKIMREKEIIRLSNENLTIENDRNRVQLENKSKELASIVMKISSINEVINKTKMELDRIQHKMVHEESIKQVGRLIHFLESELKQAESWKEFEIHFDMVHENFLRTLRKEYPHLTSKDLKMAAYLRMNMTTKEIAQFFNLTTRGVETNRFRLRKKLNLSKDENLIQFLMNISDKQDLSSNT